MDRYINADSLLIKIKAYRPYMYLGEDALSYAIKMVELEPSADVRENVRGEWITPTEKMYSMDGEDITPAYKECNRCHKVYVRTNDNFCPNCGADMRKDEEHDE